MRKGWMMMRIFGSKGKEVTEGWRKLFKNVYFHQTLLG
jgi:hypothetical protein